MANKEINYKQYRILDFDPDICGVEDGYIVLFSPYKLIIDGVILFLEYVQVLEGSYYHVCRAYLSEALFRLRERSQC